MTIPSANALFSNSTFLAEAEDAYLNHRTGILSVFTANYLGKSCAHNMAHVARVRELNDRLICPWQLAWERLPEKYLSNVTQSAKASWNSYPDDWPDLQYVPADLGPITLNDTRSFVTIAMTLQKTTARGNVSINSTDTADNPVVNTNWLGTAVDQQLAVQGVKRAREILKGAAEIVNGEEEAPGRKVQTDAQILDYLRKTVVTIHHASSTCECFVSFYRFHTERQEISASHSRRGHTGVPCFNVMQKSLITVVLQVE